MKIVFYQLCLQYSQNLQLIDSLWGEIESRYSEPHRHYHTLEHLKHLYSLLILFHKNINWDTFLMALFYHDLVYNIPSQTNEKKSALIAEKRMISLECPKTMIENVKNIILATQDHQSSDREILPFLDADLAILGSKPKEYQKYLKKIRQEYKTLSDKVYIAGRTRFLNQILEKNQIFQHPLFYQKYELQAKENLTRELYNYRNKKGKTYAK